MQRWVTDLNAFYRHERALHCDFDPHGFQWIDADDAMNSVLTFLRRAPREKDDTSLPEERIVILNATPVVRPNYHIGVPHPGYWREVLNSDAEVYGGSGVGNFGGVSSTPIPFHGRLHSLKLTLPPLSVLVLAHGEAEAASA